MKVKPTIHAELTPDGVYKEYNDPTIQEYKANNFIVTKVSTPKVYTGEILEPVDETPKKDFSEKKIFENTSFEKTNKKYLFVLLGVVAAILLFNKLK